MGVVDRLPGKALLGVVTALLLVTTFFVALFGGEGTRTVTANFSRAVSVFEGTEVRVLGVNVGQVTAVIPEGDSVRVEMEYSEKYKLPRDAQAVIVTPTLVADRFIQITPVWREGDQVLADGAEIDLPDTGTPVELDRIYQSLADLSDALGPNAANKQGSLDTLLEAGAKTMDGQGARANRMILDMSAAADTFGNNSGELFATVRNLDAFTQTLAENDRVVNDFMTQLTGASDALADQRGQLAAMLEALASALGKVRGFIRDNRQAITGEVEDLTTVLDVLVKEQDNLITALEKGPLGASNLALAFDVKTGSIGSRVQIGPNAEDLDGFLCAAAKNAKIPDADLACELFSRIYESGQGGGNLELPQLSDLGSRLPVPSGQRTGSSPPATNLRTLLGGGDQ